MATFQLLPDARGVDLPGGRSLRADAHRRITVDESIAREIRGSAAMRRYDAILEVAPGRYAGAASTDYVHECGFTPWPWQTICGRCGASLSREGS